MGRKKSGHKKSEVTSSILLVTATINLISALVALINKLLNSSRQR